MSESVDELNTELCVLQSHLDGMLSCVQQNDLKSRRFQKLEMNLLGLNALFELIEHVLDDTRRVFDLDLITFCLVDEKQELAGFLREDGMFVEQTPGLMLLENDQVLCELFGPAVRPYLGEYRKDKCGSFFMHGQEFPVSVAMLPLRRRGRYLGSLHLGSLDQERFTSQMGTDFLERLCSILGVCLENTLNFELLRRTSLIDTLTGVNNRRFFDQRIGEEIDRVQRSGESLSCLFLDIDYFKSVNDTYGHQVGDRVLAEIAGEIRSQLRNSDVLARYGGEEFVSLLSGAPEPTAIEVGERIRQTIENHVITTADNRLVKITVSVGVATFVPERHGKGTKFDPARLIEFADHALYDAKTSGRNRVVSSGVIPSALKPVSIVQYKIAPPAGN
ncbi:MAG: sensor domain-containing diguanylate cyclase [Methylococcaceae bacterium]|nr:sensor domain-containing diguanylate cyclase [Methylococcaceae bacterium]